MLNIYFFKLDILLSGTFKETILVRLPVHSLPRKLASDGRNGQLISELQVKKNVNLPTFRTYGS
jgi:hypothetical protein